MRVLDKNISKAFNKIEKDRNALYKSIEDRAKFILSKIHKKKIKTVYLPESFDFADEISYIEIYDNYSMGKNVILQGKVIDICDRFPTKWLFDENFEEKLNAARKDFELHIKKLREAANGKLKAIRTKLSKEDIDYLKKIDRNLL